MTGTLRRLGAAFLSTVFLLGCLPDRAAAASAPANPGTGPAAQSRPAAQGRPIAARRPAPDPSASKVLHRPQPVRWPTAASGTLTVAGPGASSGVDIGGLIVGADRAGPRSAAVGSHLGVRTLDRSWALRTGVTGPVIVVSGGAGPVRLSVGYGGFAAAYGGDFGARLRVVRLPACAVSTPDVAACRTATPVAYANDRMHQQISAVVDASATGGYVMALDSGESSAQGTYQATQLSQSSSWSVGLATGAFSWNYPIRVPSAPSGLVPQLGLGYSSQAMDGQTSTTNNQGSWVGAGFSYEPGYIERRYQPCAADGHATSADLCWNFANATLMLAGHAGRLVKIDNDTWKLSSDDGSRIQRLTGAVNGDNDGEYWKVTTVDGTTYYFGLNRLPGWAAGNEETNSTWTVPVYGDDSGEPCYQGSGFANSYCDQGWRWSLDRVVNPNGDTISYYYAKETNYYARGGNTGVNGSAYTRGGYVVHIDYGQRDGQVYTTPVPARVAFTQAERCLPGNGVTCAESELNPATASSWPDVPADLLCAAGTHCTAAQVSPTFFTRKRLIDIQTSVRTASGLTPVESWSLEHLFYQNDDGSTTVWLKKITHTGRWGGTPVALPPVVFDPIQLPNRVDSTVDGLGPFVRMRMADIVTESGAQIALTYATPDCVAGSLPAPGTSTLRCFPVVYHHGSATTVDWFHTYVVAQVAQLDLVGGNDTMVTGYDYLGGAAWRKTEPDGFADPADLTWSDWRGYGQVRVRGGDQSGTWTRTDHFFLRGLSGGKQPDGSTPTVTVTDTTGTTYTDNDEWSGHEYETDSYSGTDLIAKSITQPWLHTTLTETQPWGVVKAAFVRTGVTRTLTWLGNDGQGHPQWRETRSTTSYDETWGRPTQIDEEGDLSTTADDACVHTDYIDNPATYLYAFASHTQTVAVRCGATANLATQLLADDLTGYDLQAPGVAPTLGTATRRDVLDHWDGTAIQHVSTAKTTSLDGYRRPLTVADANGNVTTTAYSESYGLTTQTAVTNALTFVTTTTLDPAYGVALSVVDPNSARTDLAYDVLGRLTSVWLPNRGKAAGATPNMTFAYLIRPDKTSVVTSQLINNDGSYRRDYKLYDGLLRLRQTQQPTDGGWLLSDTFTTGTGRTKQTNAAYYATGPAGDVPLSVPAGSLQGSIVDTYDGADRVTAETFSVAGQVSWASTRAYGGDRVTVTPPSGDTATTTVVDAQGRTTELWQYHGPTPTGQPDVTRYTYTASGLLATVTDPLSNVWTSQYNQRGQKILSRDPDSGDTTYTYDANGNMTSATDARNIKVSTTYDQLNRVVETWQGEVGTGTKLTIAKYDTIKKGQPYYTARVTPTGTYYIINAAFDALYRPTSVKYQIPSTGVGTELGTTYTFGTVYNLDGTVQSITLPASGGLAAETVVNGYDALLRPNSVTGATPYLTVPAAPTDMGYDAYGELTKVQLFTGGTNKKTWLNWDYQAGTGRLARSRVTIEGSAGNQMDAAYAYDPAGNVLSVADTPGSGTRDIQCFSYDVLRRLGEAWATASSSPTPCAGGAGTSGVGGPAPYHQGWTFDAVGNRSSDTTYGLNGAADTVRTYSYPPQGAGTPNQPHIPTGIAEAGPGGNQSLGYATDPAGHTTCRPNATTTNTCTGTPTNHQTLTWDAEGHLATSVPAGGSATSYLYDFGGARLVRKEPGATTLYLPGLELRLDTTTRQVTATRFYTFAGRTVAVRTNSGVWFEAADPHGTSTVAIDAVTGASTWRRSTPYGSVRGTPPATWPDQKGFVGGTNDASGLTHLGAREYDPATGRFLSRDPVVDTGEPRQMNGYAYSGNSPVTSSDPTGLRACYDDDCRVVINTSVRRDPAPPATCIPPIRSLDACYNSLHPEPSLPATCIPPVRSLDACYNSLHPEPPTPDADDDDDTITITLPRKGTTLGQAGLDAIIGPAGVAMGIKSIGICVGTSGTVFSYSSATALCWGLDASGEAWLSSTSEAFDLGMLNGRASVGIFFSNGTLADQEGIHDIVEVGADEALGGTFEFASHDDLRTVTVWGDFGEGGRIKLPASITRFLNKQLKLPVNPTGTVNTEVHYFYDFRQPAIWVNPPSPAP